MSTTRRQFFTGAAVMAAPLAIPAIGLGTTLPTGTTESQPPTAPAAKRLALTAPTPAGEWTGADFNAYGDRIAAQVIAHTQRHAPADEQRYALVSIAAHLLQAALDEPGDTYADTGEPRGSLVDTVMRTYQVMGHGRLDLLDLTLPADVYAEFTEACRAVSAAYHPAFDDPITKLQEASLDLAVCTASHACRIGAHLAVAIHDATGRSHSIEQTRYRGQGAEQAHGEGGVQ